ncbi:xanthine dehydrogenase family protein molybdopterin-binding subunit [Hymenobacter cellulosilyticus]|uniref:Xanthine dehydrogenase family protein molybdopterin-binding subunit n=1 Tax=Hymenobacter cellulosilyticus TaxID=2932248 RepID=A0A8T9QAI7_9BACT|nr:xanthine dehydrogenase family protein molybdopterin-binding subunit [Hymenobacter cellulosilyticus]UOQ74517.1 xanthine dehydrogenase family protein molybdopterin-binding subunit [Hymenobacter cellulosilyticus]
MENQSPALPSVGQPLSRVDGRLKVTGQARYAAEHAVPGVVHGVLLTSAIARGRIKSLDTTAAEKAPGVLAILTHRNSPGVPAYQDAQANNNPRLAGREIRVFHDEQIHFSNQPVALAIADTLERAQHAATLVLVQYEAAPPETDLAAHVGRAIKPQKADDFQRGQPRAHQQAPVRIEQEYRTPVQVHNPLEPHAAIARWDAGKLTVYNKTQAPKLAQQDLMRMFKLPETSVQVHSPFVGGAFGGASRIWPQEVAAILGAKLVGRPVKVALRRDQMFNMVGYRPYSIQKVGLGATATGQLVDITHEAWGQTSRHEEFAERILDPTKSAYRCPNLTATYRLVPLDLSTPAWTRGPGESSGSFALESAVDELAYALKMDPLALRLQNFAETDPATGKPWSSNQLRQCYERGAARFGWNKRPAAPRSLRDGEWLVGQGMSMGIYKAERAKAAARVQLFADGRLLVQAATADAGPGTGTIMTQIAADASGVPAENIRFELGDSLLPPAPGQFGSHTAASVGTAVHAACTALKEQLLTLARSAPEWQNRQLQPQEVVADRSAVRLKQDAQQQLSYVEILRQHNLMGLDLTREVAPGPEQKQYAGKSFCANFVEVRVHEPTGTVRISRVVSALDVGRVLNPQTARSQVHGSVVWGIGMALLEEARLDHRYGRYVNPQLAEYHVPVNADVPAIDEIFIDEPDLHLDPMGAKGLGEIGMIGFAAAVANAVYHATGRRIRELPITPDKLLGTLA